MGKRVKQRKAAKLELELQERKAIAQRLRDKRAPMLKLLRRIALVLLVTTLLLYLGVVINKKLINAAGSAAGHSVVEDSR